MTPEQRARAFLVLARFIGQEVTAAFLRRTREHLPEAGIDVLHSLAEGIFKPRGDRYALCIWSRSAAGADRERYPDALHVEKDGTWTMEYAPKGTNLGSAVNRSLFNCLHDHVPVQVIVTARPKTAPGGARYRLLGPALIEDFDEASWRFRLRGCSSSLTRELNHYVPPEESDLLALQAELVVPFRVGEKVAVYETISRKRRERAFRRLVLEEYRHQCSVCQSKFLLREDDGSELVEAEAAHIIAVEENGPDDLRNGLSLCRRHHWAFDHGLFTITDVYTILVSPAVQRAERRRFDLEEYDGEPMVPPAREAGRPHPEALAWHRRNRFRAH